MRVKPADLEERLKACAGKCEWTGIDLCFDVESCQGKHALAAELDHVAPDSVRQGWKIACSLVNDRKGTLPYGLFKVLLESGAWARYCDALRACWEEHQDVERLRPLSTTWDPA